MSRNQTGARTAIRSRVVRRKSACALPTLLVAALLPVSPRPSLAQPQPAGGQFKVNSRASAAASNPAVAISAEGAFVVVWQNGSGVRGQRFDGAGRRVGGESPINVAGPGAGAPAVGMDADGDFLVAWREQEAQRAFRILGRRYDRAGTADGLPFQVNTSHGASRRSVVSVAMNHVGQSIVAWDGARPGLAAQLFDGAGNRLGSELAGEGSFVSAAIADDGHGAVAAALSSGASIFAYYFDLSGNWGQNFSSGGGFRRYGPAAAMAPSGRFVVVWTEEGYYGSFLRGSPNRFAIGAGDFGALSLGGDLQPSVAMGADGAFLVVWRSTGIFGQWFDPNAKPLRGRIRIDDAFGGGSSPAAAMAANGTAVVVWERAPSRRTPGGIFGRRFVPGVSIPSNEVTDATVSPDVVLPPDSRWGADPMIGAGTFIGQGVSVGDRAVLGHGVRLGARMTAGDDLEVADLVTVGALVALGDQVSLGFATRLGDRVGIGDDVEVGDQVVIGENVLIDAGAVIEPLVVIADGARIGAGAKLEMGAKVGIGACIRPGAVIVAGTRVPAGATVPPGATFP